MTHPGNYWKIPWHLMLVFFILSAGILSLGYLYYEYQAAHFQREMEAQLRAVADLKVTQIMAWRQERMHDAILIYEDPIFAAEAQDWLDGKGPARQKERILHRMQGLKQNLYEGITLLDFQGMVRLSIPPLNPEVLPLLQGFTREALASHKVVFTDLYSFPVSKKIGLSLIIPLHFHQGGEKINEGKIINVGVIVLQIDPRRFLYPLIQSWPTYSKTAEFTLVRREGAEIVYLNEFRHRKDAALTLRLSLARTEVPAVKAALGHEGIVRGVDYRGVPVLAATRAIPDSPWFLTTKIDVSEVSAPLWERFQLVAFLLLALIVSSGAGIAYFWRNRDVLFYRQQYEIERERLDLAQRYEYLAQNANDIILIMDQDLKIVEANDRAVSSYGYSREEFFGLHLWDLYPSGSPLENKTEILEMNPQDGQTFETVHRRKDGTTFPVAISSSKLETSSNTLYQQIIRDMTRSKEKEKNLRESEEQLRYLSSQLLMVQENERRRISKELHDELGLSLTVLKFQLSSFEDRLEKGKRIPKTGFQSLLHYLDEVIENVRRLSWDLSPGALEELGLATAIKNLLEEFGKHYEIHWSPTEIGEIGDSSSHLVQINIYRIFQEALTNIARHARATQITISSKKQDGYVAFTLEDNGQGFDLRKVYGQEPREKGIGLAAMQERARLAGGSLNIWSQPGAGTKITFAIPVKPEEA